MANRQVLLLGNGLNRAFGGVSWGNLINDIKVRKDFVADRLKAPMPMQAILVTNDAINQEISKRKKCLWGEIKTKEQLEELQKILSMNFDDILTTNYSYELETAAFEPREQNKERISENKLLSISKTTKKGKERRYLLHTYYSIFSDNKENRIWHIHGESRKESSIILGHYWYANLLANWKKEVDGPLKKRHSPKIPQQQGGESWLDSFLYGDVYILGFSFDISEIDLWWLLNYKKRKNIGTGQIYFYEMGSKCEEKREKIELLKLMGVKIEHCKMIEPLKKTHKSKKEIRKEFNEAIRDIETNMKDDGNQKEVETLKLKGEEIIKLYIEESEESKEDGKKDDSEANALYRKFYNKALKDIKSKMEAARSVQ